MYTKIRMIDIGGRMFNLYCPFFSLSLSAVKRENAPTPPPLSKPALTEEEVEKKSNAIIEEYLHINDMKVQT